MFGGRTLGEVAEAGEGRREAWEGVRRGVGDVGRWFGARDVDVGTRVAQDVGTEIEGAGIEGESEEEESEEESERKQRGGIFVTGNTPVFSDFVIAATFAHMRNVWGEDHERWKDVSSWDNGRWARFVDALREFEDVK